MYTFSIRPPIADVPQARPNKKLWVILLQKVYEGERRPNPIAT